MTEQQKVEQKIEEVKALSNIAEHLNDYKRGSLTTTEAVKLIRDEYIQGMTPRERIMMEHDDGDHDCSLKEKGYCKVCAERYLTNVGKKAYKYNL